MDEVKKIIEDIQKGTPAPLYFLMGEEPYYFDRIADYISGNVLSEEEKGFNQMVLYGKDVTVEEITFDAMTSRLNVNRTVVEETKDPWEQHMSIRLYSAHELLGLMAMVGFQTREVSGDIAHRGVYLGACNRELCILVEKPAH